MSAGMNVAPSLKGIAIAVIEDDEMTRAALQCILESWGCQVISADTGAALITEIKRGPFSPDIILADYLLEQGLTGIDAAHQLRNHTGREVPVIILSGATDLFRFGQDEEDGWMLMEKPCPPAKLMLSIAEALGNPEAELRRM